MADDFDFDDLDFGSDDSDSGSDDFAFDSGGDEADPFASVDFSEDSSTSDEFSVDEAGSDDFSADVSGDSEALPDMQFDINGDVDELAQGDEVATEAVGDPTFEEAEETPVEDFSSPEVEPEPEPVVDSEPAPIVDVHETEIPEAVAPAFETDTHNVENVVMATESGTPVGSEMLLNVTHEAVIEMGRTQLTGADIASITYGSIIELDKLSGEPVDVVLNGKVIAHGEIVLINNEKLGVRVIGIHQE